MITTNNNNTFTIINYSYYVLYLHDWKEKRKWIVKTHFASVMNLNSFEMIAETRSYIFRWRFRCRRRRICLNSRIFTTGDEGARLLTRSVTYFAENWDFRKNVAREEPGNEVGISLHPVSMSDSFLFLRAHSFSEPVRALVRDSREKWSYSICIWTSHLPGN